MEELRSEFVIKCIRPFSNVKTNQFFIALPFYKKGNLLEFIQNNPYLPNEAIANIFKGILLGIIDMHASNIIHNDLKPENILLSEDLVPVIGDFGLA